MNGKFLDPEDSALVNLTEKEFTDWKKKELGLTVVKHLGRYWKKSRIGFYQPIHTLARLKADEAVCPSRLSLGFRASLADEARSLSNIPNPVFLMRGISEFDIDAMPSKRRNDLRKSRKLVKFFQMKGMALPHEQLADVVISSAKRAGYWPPGREAYISRAPARFSDSRQYVGVGLVEGMLAGFIEGFAVDGTAYIQNVFIATEYLPTAVGTGLVFEFVQACRRAGGIREISYGLHQRSDEKLGAYKAGMGFPLTMVPGIISRGPIAKFISWKYCKLENAFR